MTTLQKLRARKAEIDAKPNRPSKITITGSTNSHAKKVVLCRDPQKRFESLLQCSQWLSAQLQEPCPASAIGAAIRQGRHYKGYKFKYEDEQ